MALDRTALKYIRLLCLRLVMHMFTVRIPWYPWISEAGKNRKISQGDH